MDWSLIPSFLAVADHGSLSAAARAAGISQPTLGRHIRQLEADTGAELFRRHARGLVPTEAGAALLPAARAMAEAAGRMALAASGAEPLAGPVRLTSSLVVAHYLLPPILAAIRTEEPLIEIELVASDASDNLLFREADIALRMYRPEQLDMVTRHLGDLPIGLFAAARYLEERGEPRTPPDLLSHDLVGYDRDDQIIRGMRQMGLDVTRESFATRCDNPTVYWELVRAGCGIGAGQRRAAERDPQVREVLPDLRIPPLPVWLTAHSALRRSPRITRVWDLLATSFTAAFVDR